MEVREAVLWIHLILMRIHIGKKWIWIQVISINLLIFLTKQNFHSFVLFFSLIFILKLDKPFRNQEIFIISLFSLVKIWGFGVNFFSSVFFPLDPDPESLRIAEK